MKREKDIPGRRNSKKKVVATQDSFTSLSKEKYSRRKMVSQKSYLTWLIGFMKGRGLRSINDESVLYDDTLTADNKEKLLAISELFALIDEFCILHNITQEIHEEKEISFPHWEYVFEGEGYYFSIFLMVGQGAITALTILSEEEAEKLCDFYIAIDDIFK